MTHLIDDLDERIAPIETAIRIDPARRGLLDSSHDPLGRGELAAAAASLAESGRHALIVTGFFIPSAEPPAAETDGPPGAVALALVLERLGIACTLLTDNFCAPAVRAAISAGGMDVERLRVIDSADEFSHVFANLPQPPTHLIAIERLGRTYDPRTIEQGWGAEAAREFGEQVPSESWSRLLNMRGVPIDEWTVDFSPIFENPPNDCATIGVGDGGNEIGMGKFAWGDLLTCITKPSPRGILTRVACRHAIIAGTSNWGALGLAAAVALARNSPESFGMITPESQQAILESMVGKGPAVDGVTRRAEPTVDGLLPESYLNPLRDIRRHLELEKL